MRERGTANSEGSDRHERATARLAEVGRENDNLTAQSKAGATGYAAQLLNENLNSLGAEKDRLGREVRSGQPAVPTTLTPDNLTSRIHNLLDNLGGALMGNERDAARARDVLHGLITEVKITPFDADGRRPDGRGVGAVRVQIEGEVSRLVDHAMLDRKIMNERGAGVVHGIPIATFRFWVKLDQTLSPEQEAFGVTLLSWEVCWTMRTGR